MTLLLVVVPGVRAAELHVPAQFPTIQAAIDAAAIVGDTIVVEPGTYGESLRFHGKWVHVLSSLGPAVTTIDGGLAGSTVRFIDSEGPLSILEGFRVTGGVGGPVGGPVATGGGVRIVDASPTLRSCWIENNSADRGAGIAVHGPLANPLIVNCRFDGNDASQSGGGLYSEGAQLTLEDCDFAANSSGLSGGGALVGQGAATFLGCEIRDSSAFFSGGGLAAIDADVHFDDGRIEGCVAQSGAGVVAQQGTLLLTRSIVAGNQAVSNGAGALALPGSTRLDVIHCTVHSNVAGVSGGGIQWIGDAFGVVENSVVWENLPSPFDVPSSTAVLVKFSNVSGGWTGAGNFDRDPEFVDAPAHDFRLTATSPCIDSGDPTSPLDPDGTIADVGAIPFLLGSVTTAFVRGDCNDDGDFNIGDAVFALVGFFGAGPAPQCGDACDSNDDGELDVADVVTMLGILFGGPPAIVPHGACGFDPTADPLPCGGSSLCP